MQSRPWTGRYGTANKKKAQPKTTFRQFLKTFLNTGQTTKLKLVKSSGKGHIFQLGKSTDPISRNTKCPKYAHCHHHRRTILTSEILFHSKYRGHQLSYFQEKLISIAFFMGVAFQVGLQMKKFDWKRKCSECSERDFCINYLIKQQIFRYLKYIFSSYFDFNCFHRSWCSLVAQFFLPVLASGILLFNCIASPRFNSLPELSHLAKLQQLFQRTARMLPQKVAERQSNRNSLIPSFHSKYSCCICCVLLVF